MLIRLLALMQPLSCMQLGKSMLNQQLSCEKIICPAEQPGMSIVIGAGLSGVWHGLPSGGSFALASKWQILSPLVHAIGRHAGICFAYPGVRV